MTDEQKKVLGQAIQLALSSKKIEDMEKAASISKLLAEADKQQSDAANQRNVLRNEGVKSWATILVPLLSIVTLAVTIWIQTDQLAITREANEDTAWREAVKSLSTAETTPNGIAAQTLLKPFLNSKRYHQQATELSRLALGQIASHDSFEDLFDSTFGEPSFADLSAITKVNRALHSNLRDVWDRIDKDGTKGDQAQAKQLPPSVPPDMSPALLNLLSQGGPDKREPSRDDLIHDRDELIAEVSFTCKKIAHLLLIRPKQQPVDLTGTYLNCSLSGIDFGEVDISLATVETDVAGLNFKGIAGFSDSWWSNTRWWKARAIAPQLLEVLKEKFYPYYTRDVEYEPKATRDEYGRELSRLCADAGLTCPTDSIRFGKDVKRLHSAPNPKGDSPRGHA